MERSTENKKKGQSPDRSVRDVFPPTREGVGLPFEG